MLEAASNILECAVSRGHEGPCAGCYLARWLLRLRHDPRTTSQHLDPVAHTLFGAALAESGLKRTTRYATATLLIGANLPDVDVLAGLWGGDAELGFRRGWTHGILAVLVLPALLTLGLWLWHRWRESRGQAGTSRDRQPGAIASAAHTAPAFNPRRVFALAFLAVLTHPLLDWLNTYGVRLLMPFDTRWFYGDTLFIIEPWFWLLAAAGVVVARSSTRGAVIAWSALALAATALVVGSGIPSRAVKLVWCAGVIAIALLAWRRPAWAQPARLARAGLSVLLLYMVLGNHFARQAEARAAQRFPAATEVQASPVPGNPLRHRLVIVEPELYRIIAADGTAYELRRKPASETVRSAMQASSVRGFMAWIRFPWWTVEDRDDHWLVRFQDLRYQGPDMPGNGGIGNLEVTVPKRASSP